MPRPPCRGQREAAPLLPFVGLPLLLAALAVPVRAAEPLTVLGCGVTGLPVVLRDDVVLETTGLEAVVRDFADWRRPAWVGWHETDGPFPWSDAAAGDGLVVAFNGAPGPYPVGFSLHDYRDPAAPVASAVVTGLSVRAAWLHDGALVVDAGTALVAYATADPSAPAFTALVPVAVTDQRRCFSAVGGTLYLVDDDATLRALDVADPRHPRDLGTVAIAGDRCEALVGGDGALYGLVATGDRLDLVAWATDAPSRLRETARLPLAEGPDARGRDLARAGNLLLAATRDGFVRAFDVSDPGHPIAGWRLGHDADRLAITAHAVFVRATDGLYVYARTAADHAPGEPCHRAPLPMVTTLAGDAPTAFAQLPGDPAVLVPLDLGDPARPRLGKPVAMELNGLLQCAGSLGVLRANVAELRLLDLADATAPVVGGRVTLPWPDSRALLLSRSLLVVDHNFGRDHAIDFFDVSDPDHPQRGATLHERHALATGGDWLVCGSGGSRHRDDPRVYKLDGTAQPALLGALPTLLERVHLARAVGDCVYLFGEDDHRAWWFEVHQVRDLPRPVRLNGQPLGAPAAAADVHGGLLLVQGDSDCRAWDVSDPHRPQPAGTLPAPGRAGVGFAHAGPVTVVSGRLLAVGPASAPGAVAAAPLARPAVAGAAVRLEPARPNPANGGTRLSFALDRARDLTLTVYDLRGHRVADLASGNFAAGPHTIDWDGRAAAGAALASGTYFVRLHGPGVEAVQSVTLVK